VTFDPDLSHVNVDIHAIVDDLSSSNLMTRHIANLKLSSIGNLAIPYLLPLLKFSPSKNTRKEVVKILGKIKDPESIDVLLFAMRDDNYEVRWDAAESLISIGSASILPLLKYLVLHFESHALRDGARHILRSLRGSDNCDDPLEKLFHALDRFGPVEQIPWLANDAISHHANS
jgi:HEAT repeat protein